MTIIGRINLLPLRKINLTPINAPKNCPIIIKKPIDHKTLPADAKIISAAKLVAKFTSFELIVASISPKPSKPTKAAIKNEPVPGPKKPSYQPIKGPILKQKMVIDMRCFVVTLLVNFEENKK